MRCERSNQKPFASARWIVVEVTSVLKIAAEYVAPVVMSLLSVVVRLVIFVTKPETMFARPVAGAAAASAALTV